MFINEPIDTSEILQGRDVYDRFYWLKGFYIKGTLGQEEMSEYESLEDAMDEVGEDHFENNAPLIRYDHFKDFIQDNVEEMFGIKVEDWPFWYIDWDRAIKDIMPEYMEVAIFGETYFIQV